MTDTAGAQVWLDKGAPDCDGEVVWRDNDGRRTFTCPKCSLHWYIVRPERWRRSCCATWSNRRHAEVCANYGGR